VRRTPVFWLKVHSDFHAAPIAAHDRRVLTIAISAVVIAAFMPAALSVAVAVSRPMTVAVAAAALVIVRMVVRVIATVIIVVAAVEVVRVESGQLVEQTPTALVTLTL
jgi:hypothetical protein